jgi:glutamine amidotransferase
MITIVDTGVANIASVLYALERLGKKAQVTHDADLIIKSSHVILPGVGTASASMLNLKRLELDQCLNKLTVPLMGICLGMQLLYSHSDEGDVN